MARKKITAELVRGKRYELSSRHGGASKVFTPGNPIEVTPEERDHLAKAADIVAIQSPDGLKETLRRAKLSIVEIDVSPSNSS